MQAIRTILWIGPEQGLAENGLLDAESLDVVWARDVQTACELSVSGFEAAVLALDPSAPLPDAITRLLECRGMPPLLVLAPAMGAARLRQHLPLDGGDVLVRHADSQGTGWRNELRERIEKIVMERNRNARRAAPRLLAAGRSIASRKIIGRSIAIAEAVDLAEHAAGGTTTILLQGETGTGKEIFAKAIHLMSPRADEQFVALNCAAIPDSLLESELFGYVRGAFTGATANKVGLFELARHGTLFLDEIGETSPSLQAKLLRALQEKEIRPVGSSHVKKVDVRIIAASNRDLRAEAARGTFREDLYYRLAVFPISIPPLRKRNADILLLAQHFLRVYGSDDVDAASHDGPRELSQAAAELFLTYPWPGNVRELENEIQRAVTLAGPQRLITPDFLSEPVRNVSAALDCDEHVGSTLREIVAQVEARVIRRTLANNAGKRARSAKQLGITREGLYKKMKRLGVG
jgi:transcriptional regulator with PAS, ATPase and Fis domain